jgi:hypothetical protein
VVELFQRAALIIQCSVRGFSSSTIELSRRGLSCSNTLRSQFSATSVRAWRRKFMVPTRCYHHSGILGSLNRNKYASFRTSVLVLQRAARGHGARSHADDLSPATNPPYAFSGEEVSFVSVSGPHKLHRFAFALVRGTTVRTEAKMANLWFMAAVCLQRYWESHSL